jgi:hypothetical protein
MSVAMRILGYNCVTVYRTRQGSRLVAHGIRALGRELSVGPEVIIYASGEYAVLHIEELMAIVGFPVHGEHASKSTHPSQGKTDHGLTEPPCWNMSRGQGSILASESPHRRSR